MINSNRNSLCLYTDESLVALSKDGATIAFEELVKRHSPALFRFLLQMCSNAAIAEEISQETFIRAWLRIKSFDEAASFKSWVFSIGRNGFLDQIRQEKARMGRETDWAKSQTQHIEHSLDESGHLLNQILAHFSNDHAAVLQLFYGEDFTQSEISETMQLPLGTVKSIIGRARSKIAEMIKGESRLTTGG